MADKEYKDIPKEMFEFANVGEKLSDKKFQKGYSKAFADGVENYLRYIVVF